jgi:hypothetical protein
MNKTYIANENHPELKVGTKIMETLSGWKTEHELLLPLEDAPNTLQHWYDEVKEEKSCSCSVNVCENCNEGQTVSEDKIGKIIEDITQPGFRGTPRKLDYIKLATYLAKAYKGE